MRDMFGLTLLSLGVKPENATIDDVTQAQQKLLDAPTADQFRGFYGNEYYDALAAGDLAITMAWSGDISQMQLYDNPDVKFVVPEHGRHALGRQHGHPATTSPASADAYKLMDYWYYAEPAAAS